MDHRFDNKADRPVDLNHKFRGKFMHDLLPASDGECKAEKENFPETDEKRAAWCALFAVNHSVRELEKCFVV